MTSFHRPLTRRAAGLVILLALAAILAIGLLWASSARAAGIMVTSAADGVPAADGQCTLREAILNANSDTTAGSADCAAGSGADTITFAAGLDGQTIRLATVGDLIAGPSALAITSTLTLQGSLGAGITIARDSTVANLRLFRVGAAGRLTLSNITLAGGRARGDTPATAGGDGTAGRGGAILSSSGLITLTNSTLSGNVALGGAGAANVAGAGGAGGPAMGGAIYADGGTVFIRNSTFSNNSAAGGAGGLGLAATGPSGQGQGGGVYGRDGTLIVVNSTLSDNAADQGGGMFSQSASLTATLVLTNSIIANSLGGTDLEARGANGLVPRTSGSNNLAESQSGYAGGIAVTSDPRLGPLANNGGPTQTHALLAGSPALDAGANTGAPAADQRGQLRGTVDIGAYEAHPWLSDIPDQSTSEDTQLALQVQVGDTARASASYSIAAASSNAAMTPNSALQFSGSGASRTLTITPTADMFGTAAITVTVEDGAASMQDSFTLTVLAVNDAPVAASDAYSTTEDTPLTISASGVLTNDGDIDSTALTAQLDSSTSHGTLALSTNGGFSYTPAANYCGSDGFSYHADDGALPSNSASVSITIACVNDAPIASAGVLTTTEDTRVSGALSASDSEGDPLTYSIVAVPTKGTITTLISSTGVFTYTPNADANGSDSFSFKANDGSADSNTATVAIVITPVNDAPVAASDAYSTTEDTPLTISASGVLTNDGDIDSTALTAQLDSSTSHGTLALSTTGGFTYTPAANYCGSDGFSYHADDGALPSNTATVAITVACVNDAPIASAGVLTTTEDTRVSGALSASDSEGDPLAYSIVVAPTKGTITTLISSTGVFTYTPIANANGSDSFSFKANDGSADSNIATVTIAITPVNDAPVAANDSYSATEDTPLIIVAPGTLANDSDVEGTALTAQLDSSISHGTLALSTNGGFSYTPAANYCGSDGFSYHADDGALPSNSASVSITIACVNDAPIASAGVLTTTEDTRVSGALSASDSEGDSLTYSIVAAPTKGTISTLIGSTGVFTYTPNADANGSDSFSFKANDGSADSNTATVTIVITPVNDAPRFAAGAGPTVSEDAGVQTVVGWAQGISAGPADESGQSLTFQVVSNSNSALFASGPAVAPNGTLTFTPAAQASGSATITLRLVDNGGTANGGSDSSAAQTFDITVSAVNDPPANSVPGPQAINEDAALVFNSPNGNLISVSDIDTGSSAIYITLTATGGTLTLGSSAGLTFFFGDGLNDSTLTFTANISAVNAALNGLTYQPLPNSNGSASLTIATNDLGNTGSGGAHNDTDTIAITVNAINDPPVNSVPGAQTTNEDTALIFRGVNSNLISTSDLDAGGGTMRVTLSVIDGALSLSGTSGLAFSSGDGAADMSMTFTGTLAAINAALNGLAYLPAPNDSGPTTITLTTDDGGNTGSGGSLTDTDTIAITVMATNDGPTISGLADQVTGEDISSGAIGFNISDVETLSDNLTVSTSSSNTTLLPNANTLLGGSGANRTITLIPAANQNGATTITLSVSDGVNTTTASFVLTVEPINDPPTLDAVADLTVSEDAGARVVSLSGIGAGPANESGQALAITATSDNPALIPNPTVSYSAGNASGALIFTPAADGNGVATITIHVQDNGGTSSGGSASAQRSFVINVSAVNDPPTLNPIGDIAVSENTAIPALILTGIAIGPANEGGQHLTLTATSDNPALLPSPSISYTDGAITATLSFALAPSASGVANISVRVADDGGTANGGINAITRIFAITVGLVNHRPTLDQPADQTVLEDAGTQTIGMSGISAGAANEVGQVLTLTASNESPALIADLSIGYTNGSATATLAYRPVPDANGTATIRVRVQDNGGTANGASDLVEKTFVVNITPVNDAPTFTPGPNQSASSQAGAQQIAGWVSGFTPGPADESAQIALGYTTVSVSNPALFAVLPAIDATGRLSYMPAPGADGSATIGIVARDSGGSANGGVDSSATKTFTITVRPFYQVYLPRISNL